AGVHAEQAGLRVGRAERVHGVREAALLADLLEQPRGHPAAEDRGEDAQRAAALVGGLESLAADDHVRLLDVALDVDAGREGGGDGGEGVAPGAPGRRSVAVSPAQRRIACVCAVSRAMWTRGVRVAATGARVSRRSSGAASRVGSHPPATSASVTSWHTRSWSTPPAAVMMSP